jgi:hypothetical protein
LFPLFAFGVVDTSGEFTAGVVNTEQYQTADKFAADTSGIGEEFTIGAVDTGGKFATGVVDIDSIFATGGVDTRVVHLDLRISLRIFEKIEMTLMLFSEPWGTMIHEKNPKQKIPCHCPLIAKSMYSRSKKYPSVTQTV